MYLFLVSRRSSLLIVSLYVLQIVYCIQKVQYIQPGSSKLKDRNLFTGKSPTRLESDNEILHVFYESLRIPPERGVCVCFFFDFFFLLF